MGLHPFSRTFCAGVAIAIALTSRANAQTPYLAADVRTGGTVRFTDPRAAATTSDALYFLATLPSGERALIRIGADHVPVVVRTIPDDTPNSRMVALGSLVVFASGGNLWRSDGTPAGTEVIAKFPLGQLTTNAPVAIGGTAYFTVSSALWKTDGTPAGTVPLSQESSTRIGPMYPGVSRLYFDRWDETARRLWTSDGTAAGTVAVEPTPAYSLDIDGAALGDTLIYSRHGLEPSARLLRTDGSAGSTSLLKVFATQPRWLTRLGASVLFRSRETDTVGLWRTDGTAAGTVLVRAGVDPLGMYDWNGTMVVHSRNAAGGSVLWRSDGTTGGTSEIATLSATACSSFPVARFAALPGAVVVARALCEEVWRTDGTEAGTFRLLTTPHNEVLPVAHGGMVYLQVGASGAGPSELWRTDGTPAGTVRVGDAAFAPAPSFIGSLGDAAFFNGIGFFEGALRIGLWRTTGTPASTTPEGLPGIASRATGLLTLPDAFVFEGDPNLGLHRVDTEGQTSAIAPVAVPDATFGWTATNGGLGLFPAGNGGTRVPFRTDGTASGTGPIPLPAGYSYFAAPLARQSVDPFQDGFALAPSVTTGLWFTDGTATTTLLTPPGLYCESVKSVLGRVFALCRTAQGPLSLYMSDGGSNGLTLVLTPFDGDALRLPLLELNGTVLFVHERAGRSELWQSGGVGAGPLYASWGLPSDLAAYPLTVSGGLVYFIGETAASGRELWRSDGSSEGTFRLRDIEAGIGSGLPAADLFAYDGQFAAIPGGLVFVGTSSARGKELWRTNGTVAGTVPLPEIVPGPLSPSITSLVRAGSRVFFSADDGVRGPRPWAIDLEPEARAVSIGDATVRETDSEAVVASLPVRLEGPSTEPVVVTFQTYGQTAIAYADFVPASGSLTFAPGEVAHTIDVQVLADAISERPETFYVWIDGVTGAALADRLGTGTILDDDRPRISVADASGVEGDFGPSPVVFQVTLTTDDGSPSTEPVTVRAQPVPAVADASDLTTVYPETAPTVSFPAGTPSGSVQLLAVFVQGDTFEEPNEAFHLRFESGNEASVPDVGAVRGVILDDDGVTANPPVEIAHGSRIVADLAPPAGRTSDIDFYVLRHERHSSYEVVLDAISGDAAPITLERVVPGGAVLQAGSAIGTGTSVALRFFGLGTSGEHLRVHSDACGTTCGADDVYRLRMYETTLTGARMNNVGTQVTVVILQNTTEGTVSATISLWSATGAPTGLSSVTIPPHGSAVVNTAAVLPQSSGSLVVAHDAPYGALLGKVVSADPATGFSFETALSAKPR